MKMELFAFSSKKKKRKDQAISDLDQLATSVKATGSETTSSDNLSDPAIMDKIVAGVSSNLNKALKPSPNDSAVDIIVDSDDEDEIFDDDEDDDADGDMDENTGVKSPNAANSSGGWGTSKSKTSQGSSLGAVDYREMLAAGANAIVAPMQKVMKAAEEDDTGDSYHSSDGESEEEDDHEEEEDEEDDEDGDDTESDDDEEDDKRNGGKGGDAGSDSGEDYTDDEDEGEDGYRPGGYHPVKIGEVYNQR